jgi:hypothetical protein
VTILGISWLAAMSVTNRRSECRSLAVFLESRGLALWGFGRIVVTARGRPAVLAAVRVALLEAFRFEPC